jgi:hypothetical protein
MNARLSPWLLLVALGLVTLLGPVELLAGVKDNSHLLEDREFWLSVLAATISAFALGLKAIVGIVAAALGVPLLRASSVTQVPDEPPDKPGELPAIKG